MSASEPITPADLKRELGIDPKQIRKYLRIQYGKLPPHERNWLLSEEQANDVRRRFGR